MTTNIRSSVHVVCGSYPSSLLDLWDKFDNDIGSESIRPDVLLPTQHYAIICLPHCGQDLETYDLPRSVNKSTVGPWRKSASIFWQVARALSVAEADVQFEVLYSRDSGRSLQSLIALLE